MNSILPASVLLVLLSLGPLCQCKNPDQPQHAQPNAVSAPTGTVSTVRDTSQFLAGMPSSPQSSLAALQRSKTWQTHRFDMDQMFGHFDRSTRKTIAGWRGSALRGASKPVVFYPFGGPDFLYAYALFPGASTYILVGLEGANPLPPVTQWSPGEAAASLTNLRQSLVSAVHHSYFITKDMRAQLSQTSLKGSLPPVLVFVARSGLPIHSLEMVSLNSAGHIVSGSSGGSQGYRIRAGAKTIYYFRSDLSNSGYGADKRLERFAFGQGSTVTFIKSASYLMHRGSFSSIKQSILRNSAAIVSDPSGIPYRDYGNQWKINLYGNYTGTLEMFQSYLQADLANAYATRSHPVGPLPFRMGYMGNSLIVATK